jgi:hypothetical protein
MVKACSASPKWLPCKAMERLERTYDSEVHLWELQRQAGGESSAEADKVKEIENIGYGCRWNRVLLRFVVIVDLRQASPSVIM